MRVFSLITVAFSSLFLPALAKSCARSYTVKDGDICDSISAANHASTYQLAIANPSINPVCSNLMPGQVVCLGYSDEDCMTTYVVKPNDDCEIVSSAHKISMAVFRRNNPQLNAECSNMYIGEVLCVAQSVIMHAPPKTMPASAIPLESQPARPHDSEEPLWCD